MTQQAQQSGTPQAYDPETAYAIVHQRVYVPAFFEKLASDYGWRPKTQEEVHTALQMAAQLREAFDAEQEKIAMANNPLSRAQQHLNQVMREAGYPVPHTNQYEQQIKQAAAQGSFDPQLASAVLSLHATELHQELAQQQQA